MKAFTSGPFTGRHFSYIIVAFFAVVIAVNVVMARLASSTFGGVVVDNSYVASQHFNRWLDEAAREQALGWQIKAERRADDRLRVTLIGAPDSMLTLAATARHPLGRLPDLDLAFDAKGGGHYVSRQPLPPGRWRLRLSVASGGHSFRTEQDVR